MVGVCDPATGSSALVVGSTIRPPNDRESYKNLKYKILLKLHKFKQLTKHFLNHSILTTKYGNLDHKHPINYLNGIKESFVSINIKITWLNKEKFAKNTFIYQNLIGFSWAFVSFKKKITFKSTSIFVFTTMATYKKTYKLWILTHTHTHTHTKKKLHK